MVHGIVSLLDEPHYLAVEELWREFERRFGVSWLPSRVPFPHISFHVAEEYAIGRVEEMLSTLALGFSPIRVRTAGLGIFTASEPVLTLTVVRSPELDAMHRRIWEAVSGMTAGVMDYYRPENWVPHITLAQGDLNSTNLPRLVGAMIDRRLDWEIMIDNLTLMYDDGIKHDIRQRVDIGMVR